MDITKRKELQEMIDRWLTEATTIEREAKREDGSLHPASVMQAGSRRVCASDLQAFLVRAAR